MYAKDQKNFPRQLKEEIRRCCTQPHEDHKKMADINQTNLNVRILEDCLWEKRITKSLQPSA